VEFDGRIPISKGKLVYRFSQSLTQSQRSFLEKYGGDLFLDPSLGTLRFFSPAKGVQLFRPRDARGEDLVYVVLRFLEENRETFKIRTDSLLLSEGFMIDEGHHLLLFCQTAGGAPICGTAVRVVVSGSESREGPGFLKSIKAFVLEDPPSSQMSFAPREIVEDVLAGEEVQLTFAEKQCYFPRYDASSLKPVWYARGTTADGDPMAFYFDAQSGELLEKREIVSELGEVTGAVAGLYPDPENVFAVANQISRNPDGSPAFFPVAGARVAGLFNSPADNAVTDRDGAFMFPIKDGTASLLQCTLEYGRCGNELFKDPAAGESCANADFNVYLRVVKGGQNVGCGMEPTSRLLTEVSPGPVGDQDSVAFIFNSAQQPPALLTTTSLQLMTFHHVRKAMVEMLNRISSNKIDGVIPTERRVYPLTVSIPYLFDANDPNVLLPQPNFLQYRPDKDFAKICLTAFLDKDQAMTPTLILHEAAGHHAIALITGTLQTKGFDCVGLPGCIEQDPDQRNVFEGKMLEGFADGLAAYAANTSKFGYYAANDPTNRGSFSYDIADVQSSMNRFNSIERAEVAKALWEIREGFTSVDPPRGRDVAANLLYRFLAQNRTVNGTDRIFDPSILLNELLAVLDRRGFTDGSDDNRDTISKWDRQVINAFSGLKISDKPFIRGDANQDLDVDLSDAIWILGHLFDGKLDPRCLDAMDVDSTGELDLTDPIYLLNFSFLGGPRPPQPFPECNVTLDPAKDPLGCEKFACKF
jgi:hypothetical protein